MILTKSCYQYGRAVLFLRHLTARPYFFMLCCVQVEELLAQAPQQPPAQPTCGADADAPPTVSADNVQQLQGQVQDVAAMLARVSADAAQAVQQAAAAGQQVCFAHAQHDNGVGCLALPLLLRALFRFLQAGSVVWQVLYMPACDWGGGSGGGCERMWVGG
jgi:hypothetical protein